MRAIWLVPLVSLLFVGCDKAEDAALTPTSERSVNSPPTKRQREQEQRPEMATSPLVGQKEPLRSLPRRPSPESYEPDNPEFIAASQLEENANRDAQRGILSSTTQWHEQYENEDRQDDWASFVEEKLRNHFLNARFSTLDVVSLGCKSSICEIVAVTRDGSDASVALDTWQNEVWSLPREEWWKSAQMLEPTFQVSSARGNRALFVTHLLRKTGK